MIMAGHSEGRSPLPRASKAAQSTLLLPFSHYHRIFHRIFILLDMETDISLPAGGEVAAARCVCSPHHIYSSHKV